MCVGSGVLHQCWMYCACDATLGLLWLQDSWSERRRLNPQPSALLNRTRKRVKSLAIDWFLPLISVRNQRGRSSSMFSESSGTTGSPHLTVIPSREAFGAEIRNVDLRTIDGDDFSSIYRAWLDHSVLLFRGQILTDDDLIAFSKMFGDLDWAPIQESGRRFVEGHPEIYVVSNVIKNGEPIGSLGAGEATWHTDMSYLEDPPKASILYSLEVPPAGGK